MVLCCKFMLHSLDLVILLTDFHPTLIRSHGLGRDDDVFRALETAELKAFSDLAFACGTPQAPPDETTTISH